jgi:acyl-coenzyme A synthetase/AMP-(fatty) acid ligase/acyl carrier protein
MLSGVSHDPLLRDVLTPLSLGATLCVPDPQDFDTPGGLATYVQEHGITVLHLTPALGRLLADAAFPLPSLRYLFFGGDMLRDGLLQALRAQAPGATFVNFYGTTETPQAMGCHVVEALRSGPDGRIPIGRGIEGCQLLIETAAGIQAGIGEPGEVHVRSPHLCKGFLKDRTDPTDPTDPTDQRIGGDRFPTGDLGRYLPDGSVVLAGRADDQLKIRGFRVEPSEVEAALEIHPAVRQAAVVARESPSGEDRLVAFVVGEADREVSAVELQQFVRTALPEPMVPSLVVFAERLPLTANGKVDRRALPAVDGAGQPEPCHVPPRNDVERALARIWSDVLGLEQVGATDHFFGLGGHSLLAVRMLSLLRNAFQVELPLRTIFEAPTVAALAEAVDKARERGGALLPAIGRISRDKHRIELKPSD